jgi:hypothetical protein
MKLNENNYYKIYKFDVHTKSIYPNKQKQKQVTKLMKNE